MTENTETSAGEATPRYSWIVRDNDDEPWALLAYRWISRVYTIETTEHWLRHYEQAKAVEVIDGGWTVIE